MYIDIYFYVLQYVVENVDVYVHLYSTIEQSLSNVHLCDEQTVY